MPRHFKIVMYNTSTMIFILIVCAFAAVTLYKLVGMNVYWISGLIGLWYFVTFKETPKKQPVEKFMEADVQLQGVLRDIDKHVEPILKAKLHTNITEFYDLYLQNFTEGPTEKFSDLLDKRRSVLNEMSIATSDLPESLIHELSSCMWKYVKVIITKYDIPYTYPIAHNTYDKYDLY